jgi:pimeloyl-ACP methyl ester carboxylesterase
MRKRHVALAGLSLLALTWLGVGLLAPEAVLRGEFARQRWLAGAAAHSVVAANHRWRYLQSGQRGPLLVLLHGFTGSKENWLPLMRALGEDVRVIAPDLPGWGESERRVGEDYGPSAQAQRLAAFLAALPEPPALVVGHSTGGQVVGLLAVEHPELVPRLLLMSAAGVRFRDNQFGRAVLAGENPFQATDRAEVHRYLGIVFTDPPFVPWPVDEALARQRRRDAAFEQQVLDRIGRGPEALKLQSLLPRVQAPTLLLWCRDDRVIDVSSVPIFRAGLPQSDAVLFDGCGHMPMMARPQETAQAIKRFL